MKTDKFTLYCHFLVLLITTVCSQNINNQIVNIADKKLTNYSFHSRYPYTKSKNYLKRQYRICHWIPMFTGTLCISIVFVNKGNLLLKMASFIKISKELDRYQRKKTIVLLHERRKITLKSLTFYGQNQKFRTLMNDF